MLWLQINLYTDPRHGRGQEAFSEDPFLTAELGVAWVLGQQVTTNRNLDAIAFFLYAPD